MIPQARFDGIARALETFNADSKNFKRIPEGHRGPLIVALKALSAGKELNLRDMNNAYLILELYKDNEIPSTSVARKIQKAIHNLFGRVSSQDLIKASKEAEAKLWLNRGEDFLKIATKENDHKAFKAFEKAALLGDAKARGHLGRLFFEKRHPEEKLHEYSRDFPGEPASMHKRVGLVLLTEAARKRDPMAQKLLGEYFVLKGQPHIGEGLLHKAAAQKNPEAQKMLRMLKSVRKEADPIKKLALLSLLEAVDQCKSLDQKDCQKAIPRLRTLAALGDPHAAFLLGILHFRLEGRSDTALQFFKEAERMGLKHAEYLVKRWNPKLIDPDFWRWAQEEISPVENYPIHLGNGEQLYRQIYAAEPLDSYIHEVLQIADRTGTP